MGRRFAGAPVLWRFLLVVGVLPMLGCERGCLSKAYQEKKKSVESPIDLTGTDCPADLFRCRGGRIERSTGGHVASRCERGEACGCPFVPEAECQASDGPSTCLLEDVEVSLEESGQSLCVTKGARSMPVLAPALDGVCDSDDTRCVGGAVVRCSPTPRTVARCLRGCAGAGRLEAELSAREIDVLCRP